MSQNEDAQQVSDTEILEALSLLQPFDVDRRKVRRGSNGDGGYVFVDIISAAQPVLSFGVGKNCDLEVDFASAGHNVFMFDPTVDGPPKKHNNFKFSKIGVRGDRNTSAEYKLLNECIKLSSLDERNDIILKMDVEGAELEVFSECPTDVIKQFEQIALELHWIRNLEKRTYHHAFVKSFAKLSSTHVICHVHANNCTPVRLIGGKRFGGSHIAGGVVIADTIELLLVRRDLIEKFPSRTFYPTRLDFPNHPGFPDHILSFFPFLPTLDGAASSLASSAELSALRSRAR